MPRWILNRFSNALLSFGGIVSSACRGARWSIILRHSDCAAAVIALLCQSRVPIGNLQRSYAIRTIEGNGQSNVSVKEGTSAIIRRGACHLSQRVRRTASTRQEKNSRFASSSNRTWILKMFSAVCPRKVFKPSCLVRARRMLHSPNNSHCEQDRPPLIAPLIGSFRVS